MEELKRLLEEGERLGDRLDEKEVFHAKIRTRIAQEAEKRQEFKQLVIQLQRRNKFAEDVEDHVEDVD